MYQCSKRLVKYKEYSCFDHSDFLAHSVFTFDVCWAGLGTFILENSSSASNNTWSRLPSRLSFCFLWLWLNAYVISFINASVNGFIVEEWIQLYSWFEWTKLFQWYPQISFETFQMNWIFPRINVELMAQEIVALIQW